MTARWVLRLQSQLPKASILCHSLSQIVVVGRPTFECRRRDLIYTQQRHVGSRAWQNPGLRRCLAVGPWSTNIVSKRRAPGKRHRQSPYLISARDSVITEARKTCSDHTVVYGARFQSSSDDELPQRNCMRKERGDTAETSTRIWDEMTIQIAPPHPNLATFTVTLLIGR